MSALILPTFPAPVEIRTARCLLRQWRDDDLPAWIAMNQDSAVREHFPSVHTPESAFGEFTRMRAAVARRGWGPWAVEVTDKGVLAGFVGLMVHGFNAPWQPAVEIGWRLAREHWGKGYATEAARGVVQFAFENLKLAELVSMTIPMNIRSRAVMERLGFTRNEADDFDHPRVDDGHPMKRHVLYRLKATDGQVAP